MAGLWKLALESQFESEELESLREELVSTCTSLHPATTLQVHYESRLEKMHFLRAELQLVDERHGGELGTGILRAEEVLTGLAVS